MTWLDGAIFVGLSLAFLIGSMIATPYVLTRIPADYFKREKPHILERIRAASPLRACAIVAKNLGGLLLVLAGIAMLVLPGQGLLTILIGMLLLDFPGKQRAERALVEKPQVRKAIDWLRTRAGQPPLDL